MSLLTRHKPELSPSLSEWRNLHPGGCPWPQGDAAASSSIFCERTKECNLSIILRLPLQISQYPGQKQSITEIQDSYEMVAKDLSPPPLLLVLLRTLERADSKEKSMHAMYLLFSACVWDSGCVSPSTRSPSDSLTFSLSQSAHTEHLCTFLSYWFCVEKKKKILQSAFFNTTHSDHISAAFCPLFGPDRDLNKSASPITD